MKTPVNTIHDASMAVLAKTGLDFHAPWAVDALRRHGLAADGRRVFFHETELMNLIGQAPANFTLTARRPEASLTVGGSESHYGPGLGAAMVVGEGGRFRPAEGRDLMAFLKLFHSSPLIRIMGASPVVAGDWPGEFLGPLQFYALLRHTDKALLAPGGRRAGNGLVLELAAAAFGGREALTAKVHFLSIVSTLSPLAVAGDSLEALSDFLAAGQGVVISPCALAGGTAPMTLAGLLAQSNAEILGVMALAQILKPGAPMVYGLQSTVMDPRTGGLSVGAPEQALCLAWGAEMARFYGVPSRGGGALTDADRVGPQSGYEAMMTALASRRAGLNLILQSAGILGGLAAMSLDQALVDLEILAMVERLMAGAALTPEHLALEIIHRAGPGGNFLASPHTVKHCRRELYQPRLSRRGPLGGPDDFMEKRLAALKESAWRHPAPDVSPELAGDLERILTRRGLTPPPLD